MSKVTAHDTFVSNEEQIQDEISDRKEELIEALNQCYDTSTNALFNLDENGNYSLTFLCQETTRIQSLVDNNATYPSNPPVITENNLITRELNIKNKIQYCNNLLRYTLRKNGINFNNSNKMHELIDYIKTIYSIKKYDGYISNIDFTNEGNLEVTYIQKEDIIYSNLVTDITFNEGVLSFNTGSYNNNYEDLYIKLDVNNNGELIYEQVKDDN